MKEIHKIKIEPLTAVHIGTGEKLLPLDYTLAAPNNSGSKKYVKFNSDKIIRAVLDSEDKSLKQKLQEVSDQNNVDRMCRFFREHFWIDNGKAIDYDAAVTKEFERLFSDKSSDGLFSNAREVDQMLHNGNMPYIPGSSVKGAVRTAVLNNILLHEMDDDHYDALKNRAEKEKQNDFKKKGTYEKTIQNMALHIDKTQEGNYAQKDPFRCLEFTDCKFSSKAQIVGCIKNIKIDRLTKELTETGMQIIAEAIPCSLLGGKYSAEFSLRINTDLQNADFGEKFHINKKINIRDIIDSCNFFFKKQFDEEYKTFYRNAVEHVEKIDSLKKIIDKIIVPDADTGNQFIIRLGRWSQVEFVTFGNDFRNPKTPYGKTRSVLNDDGQYIPMGWCKCTVEAE
ncbi:MAG: type III-A CRISPR-associated RAMP protein Csm5 [Bacteroides sp.]|nr:type III-A CRISPR-associated RAMP protein Csm5 [Prevotella sp.]MCM1406946.1 type III-A CRISPR-associated RAMP protein Csm5 [Treponema brennaborense]MCM1470097.1 type III-A CRISPR-associated RAMP protein Csm5 [Bacteroides sp.]